MRWTINHHVMHWPGLTPAAKIAWHQLSAQLEADTGHLHGAELLTSTAAIADAQDLPRTTAWRVIQELHHAGFLALQSRGRGPGAKLKIHLADPRRIVPPAEQLPNRSIIVPPAEQFPAQPSAQIQPPQHPATNPRRREPPQNIQGATPQPTSIPARAPERSTVESSKNSLQRSTVSSSQRLNGSCAGAQGDEIRRLHAIGSAIADVLAKVPGEIDAKHRLSAQLGRWIQDPTLHRSILDRVAEALVLDQVPYDRVAQTVADVLGMRLSATGLKKPAGALWIHLLKRIGFTFNAKSRSHAQ